MNQKRFQQMRSMNRQEQGLQHILQPSAAGQLPGQPGQGGSQAAQQSVRRKMTYTRTELLCRGLPTTQIPRRSPRTRGTYVPNTTLQSPGGPQTPLSAGPGNGATSTGIPRVRSYLPRPSRLQSPNRNLTRMRTELEPTAKQEPGLQKKSPYMPNTPHVSHSNIPYPGPGVGQRPMRHEGSGIPVLNSRKQRIEQSESTDTSSLSTSPTVRVDKPIPPLPLPLDSQKKSFVYLCKPVKKVKELLTARRLRHSCENLEELGNGSKKKFKKSNLQKTNSEELLHSKAIEQGLELSSITEMSISPSSSTASQLQLQLQLPLQHQQLRLQQKQLQQQQLEDSSQEQTLQQYLMKKKQRQREMDKVCQNLPTLQHEIRLLQALNEKLETTLRGSNAARQRSSNFYDNDTQSSTVFYTPRCGPMLFEEMAVTEVGFLHLEHVAWISQRATIVAFAYSMAVVREYRIETKTLNELKASDETQCFYLPQQPQPQQHKMFEQQSLEDIKLLESDGGGPPTLQCTNLRMLRENPSVLLQQLRRGAGGGYNPLDHDMFMFINSLSKKSEEDFLYTSLAVGLQAKAHPYQQELYSQLQSEELMGKMSCKQVNSITQTEDEEEMEELPVQEKQQEEKQQEEKQQEELKEELEEELKEEEQEQQWCEAPPVELPAKPKRKIRKPKPQQVVTKTIRKARIIKRSPIQSNGEPKVHLKIFKTVVVGFVQVCVFLVLIMAFMYPDVNC